LLSIDISIQIKTQTIVASETVYRKLSKFQPSSGQPGNEFADFRTFFPTSLLFISRFSSFPSSRRATHPTTEPNLIRKRQIKRSNILALANDANSILARVKQPRVKVEDAETHLPFGKVQNSTLRTPLRPLLPPPPLPFPSLPTAHPSPSSPRAMSFPPLTCDRELSSYRVSHALRFCVKLTSAQCRGYF